MTFVRGVNCFDDASATNVETQTLIAADIGGHTRTRPSAVVLVLRHSLILGSHHSLLAKIYDTGRSFDPKTIE